MMKSLSISDKILLSPFWLITLLPLPILYFFSDILSLILYFVVRYRKKIVFENLTKSFPKKDKEEIKKIARKFYKYLCDYFIESIYVINMSLEECNRRYIYTNPDLLNNLYKENKNIIIATSHYSNWEWSSNLGFNFSHKIYGIYKPLSNKVFDRLFIGIRKKYGTEPIPMKKTLRAISESLSKNEVFGLIFVADQRPGKQDLDFWTTFMNQKTPVITGMDRLARKYDMPIVFMNIQRQKRGYYEITHELIVNKSTEMNPNDIAEKYIRSVEKQIIKQPEFYLWSHKRWKYKAEELISGEIK